MKLDFLAWQFRTYAFTGLVSLEDCTQFHRHAGVVFLQERFYNEHERVLLARKMKIDVWHEGGPLPVGGAMVQASAKS